jgi:23S rRNA pseudouridine1911/1915/1917 synthase
VITFVADEEGRIDRVIARKYPDTSRRLLAELFDSGAVRVGGRTAKKGDRVAAGVEVTLAYAPAQGADLRPAPDPDAAARVTVLHLDDEVVVIAKPAGMPSQPLRPGELGTAAGALAALHPECAATSDDPRDGGLVHRLDIGTSGALIAARTRAAWLSLRAAFAAGEVDKAYLALVEHAPVANGCDLPLTTRGRKAAVDLAEGLEAHTSWELVSRHGDRRLLRCQATTGRMHQVRAHLAHCGAPIVGDELYGGAPFPGLTGFFLHAATVRFAGRSIEAPLPPDRLQTLAQVSAGNGPLTPG